MRLPFSVTLKPYLQAPKKRKLPLKKDDVSKNHAGRDTAAVSEFQPRALSFFR